MSENIEGSVTMNEAQLVDGQLVITHSITKKSSELTSECWQIQFKGLHACQSCELLDTDECGGIRIRKQLLKEIK